tara:strand:- start:30 stop:641 length:612 start_codon:yes stop_codon:yes gene_type:complete
MKSLRKGIGNRKDIENYYDDWSSSYDETLNKWNYKAPLQSANILKRYVKTKPKYLLDLACGTGLFVEKFLRFFPDCICDGSDISKKILDISKKNGKYRNLYKKSFEKKLKILNKYNIISLIGAMTYCQNHQSLFKLVSYYLTKNGYFIFTHRVDLWRELKFDNVLKSLIDFELVHKSKSLNYLPKNKDFSSDIKIRIVLLIKK